MQTAKRVINGAALNTTDAAARMQPLHVHDVMSASALRSRLPVRVTEADTSVCGFFSDERVEFTGQSEIMIGLQAGRQSDLIGVSVV